MHGRGSPDAWQASSFFFFQGPHEPSSPLPTNPIVRLLFCSRKRCMAARSRDCAPSWAVPASRWASGSSQEEEEEGSHCSWL